MKLFFTFFCLLSLIGLSKIIAQTVIDIDGNVYDTISIGNQVWMKQNLKTTKYRDGTSIPNVNVNSEWGALTTGALCYYNNSIDSSNTYGALYNWYATYDALVLCPTDWHLPSDADWTQLINYLGGTSVAGGKMKEAGTSHWWAPNAGATNSSGFSALPGGLRFSDGTYSSTGDNGYWWSSTESFSGTAWKRDLYSNGIGVNRGSIFKSYGLSVRCLRDFNTDIQYRNYFEQIKLYPNPANDKIEVTGINKGVIEIINLQGQIVKSLNTSSTNITIDISKLSCGIYTMKIKTGNSIIVKKLIKQ